MKWAAQIPVRDNIKLRLLVPDDSARVFEILEKDPKIREKFVTWTAGLTSEEAVREAIGKFQENPVIFRFAIVDGDRLIGYVGTWSNTPDGKEYDAGYFIDPDERGKGIVTIAMKALIEAASKNLSVELFAMYIWDGNEPSKAVAKKLGFTQTDRIEPEPALGGIPERRWELSVKK
jgi:RimJ/RimL family protein N-acetyltransferase